MIRTLSLSALATAVLLGAMLQNPAANQPLQLQWAAAEPGTAPPLAVMVELGAADTDATVWSGKYTLTGAQVLKRTALGFRKPDKFTDENAWTAKSHPVPRWWNDAGPRPVRTVGFVLQLNVEDAAAALHVETPAGAAALKLADLDRQTVITALDGKVRFTRVSQTAELAAGETEDDFPAACIGPDGALHVAYVSYTLSEPARREPVGGLNKEPDNFDAYALPTAGDQIWLRTRRGGKWGNPLAITAGRDDICRIAVAAAADGTAWVGYAARRNGNFDVHVRPFAGGKLGAEQALSTHAEPDINPVMVTEQSGRAAIAWQGFRDGKLQIFVSRLGENGKWSQARQVSQGQENCWHPALASSPDGKLAVAWDQYRGDYDVLWSVADGDAWSAPAALAASHRFEARPSLVYDAAGRLWVAYEDGPEKWGKDYGALDENDGRGLYHGHQVRVLVVVGDKVMASQARLPTAEPNDENRRLDGPQYSHPQLGLDPQGNLWLTYRQAFGTRYHTAVGAYWMSFARQLLGANWSEPVLLHRSDGLLDNRPVLLPNAAGGVTAVFSGDSRYHNPDELGNNVFVATIAPLGEAAGAPTLAASNLQKKPTDDSEARDVAAIRAYRVKVDGKQLRLLRGEFHRHTAISWDGRPDGSITDMYRYAIDAAAMDWIGNGDHDHGGGREYPWWVTQKLNDALHSPGVFIPMFTYERSVSYPHGHRNAMFAQRGIRTLPRLTEGGRVSEGDTKMFYRYLKQFGGICASHTSATGMGTDWRDNDPVAEPIVEIYQGDRNSYEYAGAPRSGDEKTNLGGWRPKGFIDLALKNGVKLGFQASSDHWSTHISYCVAMAEDNSREGILAALKKRHCYGATDNIILDVTAADGKQTMGDSFVTRAPPQLAIYVRGTGPLARVDILRDSEVVETIAGKGNELRTHWTDPEPLARGEHYYYVRVLQKNNEIAWGSPMWIRFEQ